MARHPFLSPGWIDAARQVQSEQAEPDSIAPVEVRMNLVVEDVPFGSGVIDAHVLVVEAVDAIRTIGAHAWRDDGELPAS